MKPISILQSVLSGWVWGFIAWLLLSARMDRGLVIAMVTATPIGMLMGAFSKGFLERPILARAGIALVTLYGAVALFGVASGIEAYLFGTFGPGNPRTLGLVWLAVWYFVAGMTMTGYVVILWPFAYINHLLIARGALPKTSPPKGARGWR
jgi:hypothetical protein